ncbi:MAG: low-specificity L-threonine aldolase [Limnochordia bacterium]|jgi:threonine aldolase
MAKIIDFRSDTVTLPTAEMLKAIATAPLGDDMKGEDPTVNKLEEMAAQLVGKEAALLLTSGTAGNLVAMASHTNPGEEIILEAKAHIYWYEAGGIAALCNCLPRLIPGHYGVLDPDDVQAAIRDGSNVHHPPTTLVCLENTHNGHGGTVMTIEQMKAIKDVAHANGLKVHLDGARVFNAAVALGVHVREIAAQVDSLTFCLSKGLACPVGAILCGSAEFIAKARRVRKVIGGSMRQAGIIAAPGIVALEKMIHRLADDHANARLLAEALAPLGGIKLDLATVQTNIVRFALEGTDFNAHQLAARLKERNILIQDVDQGSIRMVTHKDISRGDVDYTIDVFRGIFPN